MSTPKSKAPPFGLGSINRKPLGALNSEMIRTERLQPGAELPLVIKAAVKGLDLIAWAGKNRGFIESCLLKHEALLFRDFDVNTVEEFEQFIVAICGEALQYRYRASPRSQVSGNIYTSTDYPADQSIFPHNEHAYSPAVPLKIFFYCVTPALEGGQTPIGSGRRILQRIKKETLDRFIEKNVMYVRNLGDGFGLPWQTVFQTEDKAVVEEYCRTNKLEFEWKSGDRLRTRLVGPAVVRHPRSGEMLWFDHATFFHVSTLEPTVRDALMAEFNDDDLPNSTFYGDGSPIEPAVLDELRSAYLAEMVVFDWQRRDILLLDNMLAVHGRRPYAGPRKIVVGMAEPVEISA